MNGDFEITKKQLLAGIIGVSFLIILLFLGKIVEDVAADEIIINQVPISGTLEFWTTPGLKFQAFGDMQTFDKSFQVWFSNKKEQGGSVDQSIKIVFNDAGEARLSGSSRLLMPKSDKKLSLIKMDFGNFENLKHELIRPTLTKVVFSTGPLLSSFESYAVKKNDLIRYIEDQLRYGIYKTVTKQVERMDELSGKMKNISVAELVENPDSPGGFERQEDAPLSKYGLDVDVFVTVEDIIYEDKIMRQISQQQKALMDVQTSIAEAKKAKQEAIRAEEQGKADYAKAKWKQEEINAKEIAEAEKGKRVAELDMEKAKFQKQADILQGQGIATKKRLIMQADGALDKKLKAFVEINKNYADAIKDTKSDLVPSIIMGGGSSGKAKYANSVQGLVDLLMAKTAKDMNLDISTK